MIISYEDFVGLFKDIFIIHINYQIRIWNKKFNSILFSVNELEFLSRAFDNLFVHGIFSFKYRRLYNSTGFADKLNKTKLF